MPVILLESISGLVQEDSAERLLDHVHQERFPLPALEIGRVSIQHSLEKLADSGVYKIDDLISVGTGVNVRLRGTLRLFNGGRTLVGNNAVMTVFQNAKRTGTPYYLIKGKPTLSVLPVET